MGLHKHSILAPGGLREKERDTAVEHNTRKAKAIFMLAWGAVQR